MEIIFIVNYLHLTKEELYRVTAAPATDVEDEYKKNDDYFKNKQNALNSLMSKLDTLGQIMYVQRVFK